MPQRLPWRHAAWVAMGSCGAWTTGQAQVSRTEDPEAAQAVAGWRSQAAAGNAQAQFNLGVAYDLGRGVRQDEVEACRWYRRAGERGLVLGQFNIAVMYDAGRCGPRDAEAAAEWYGRAAASSHGRAEYNLAQMYSTGDGVPRNVDQAAAWYHAAALHGVAAAAEALRDIPAPASKAGGEATLHPAIPSAPRQAIPVSVGNTAFVWQAPSQPAHVRFFLEVYSTEQTGWREVFARYVTQSATLVPLGPKPAHYLWRVYVVSDRSHDYVASAPCEFDTEAEPRS